MRKAKARLFAGNPLLFVQLSVGQLNLDELMLNLADMEKRMKQAAKNLDFEQAALLRDEIRDMRKFLPAEARR